MVKLQNSYVYVTQSIKTTTKTPYLRKARHFDGKNQVPVPNQKPQQSELTPAQYTLIKCVYFARGGPEIYPNPLEIQVPSKSKVRNPKTNRKLTKLIRNNE